MVKRHSHASHIGSYMPAIISISAEKVNNNYTEPWVSLYRAQAHAQARAQAQLSSSKGPKPRWSGGKGPEVACSLTVETKTAKKRQEFVCRISRTRTQHLSFCAAWLNPHFRQLYSLRHDVETRILNHKPSSLGKFENLCHGLTNQDPCPECVEVFQSYRQCHDGYCAWTADSSCGKRDRDKLDCTAVTMIKSWSLLLFNLQRWKCGPQPFDGSNAHT